MMFNNLTKLTKIWTKKFNATGFILVGVGEVLRFLVSIKNSGTIKNFLEKNL